AGGDARGVETPRPGSAQQHGPPRPRGPDPQALRGAEQRRDGPGPGDQAVGSGQSLRARPQAAQGRVPGNARRHRGDLGMSDNDPSAADPLGQIADEFVEAYRRGQRPSVEEFARRYPDHADDLREILPALVLMEKAKPGDDTSSLRRRAKVWAAASPLQQLGDYQILREVGRGGMGVVYEAQQLSLGRHVAIKVLAAHALLDPRQLARFRREARSAARLHHTNIVPVFGVGEQDGLHYYVMQFIPELGLDDVLEELQRLQPGKPGSGSTPGPTGGELRVSRKEISSTELARSLTTGRFTPAAAKEDNAPAARCDATVAAAPGAIPDPA